MDRQKRQPLSVLGQFPQADTKRAEEVLQEALKDFDRKIVVLDDDPTGVQTVHGVFVYTDWEQDTILEAFEEEAQMFFILTNSRSFSAEETKAVHRQIAERVSRAAQQTGKEFVLISRGDSTLRGHYLLETEILRESISAEQGYDFDGEIICPFFPEGGRYTFGNVHYVREGDTLIPAGMTEFAQDKSFGYQASDLTEYVQEKTGGDYQAAECICISVEELRAFDVDGIYSKLMSACGFDKIILNAVCYEDVKVFCAAFVRAVKAGKHFLARTAAAFPKVLADISDRPLLTREELVRDDKSKGGIVLIGSHVKKTTEQLNCLRESVKNIFFLEFNVNSYFQDKGLEHEVDRVIAEAEHRVDEGVTVVIYTSRNLLVPDTADRDAILEASVKISGAVTNIIGRFGIKPGFIVAKGGITSSDVGTKALKVRKALVMGQAKKGIPVWMTGAESKFPGMPYIIFPGNVGERSTLREIVEELM